MALSVKELIQQCQTKDGGVQIGTVVKTNPIDIVLVNDEKFHVRGRMLQIPAAYSDYEIEVEIQRENGTKYTTTGKVKNALKAGDSVVLLGYNEKKNYVVIGKV